MNRCTIFSKLPKRVILTLASHVIHIFSHRSIKHLPLFDIFQQISNRDSTLVLEHPYTPSAIDSRQTPCTEASYTCTGCVLHAREREKEREGHVRVRPCIVSHSLVRVCAGSREKLHAALRECRWHVQGVLLCCCLAGRQERPKKLCLGISLPPFFSPFFPPARGPFGEPTRVSQGSSCLAPDPEENFLCPVSSSPDLTWQGLYLEISLSYLLGNNWLFVDEDIF